MQGRNKTILVKKTGSRVSLTVVMFFIGITGKETFKEGFER